MHKKFFKWIKNVENDLVVKGITTENINVTDDNVPNPSITVDNFSQVCIGRISVWETGEMDVEVLHFETEERLMYEHYELGDEPDFDKILIDYLNVLSTGTKL